MGIKMKTATNAAHGGKIRPGGDMKYLLEGQDIGVFNPNDLAALQRAFTILSVQLAVYGDDAEARKLARSLIQLYRHGVRDPDQLVAALDGYRAA
jgi:hypothetical protein